MDFLFYIYFHFFKFQKYDNTFTGDLENITKLHTVPLYVTIIFLRILVWVSISNPQKLIEWIYREVEGYSRLENLYEPIQHN